MNEETSVSNATESVSNESETKPETINYDTHKKLLNQRKSDQEKMRNMEQQLNEFMQAQKANEENKLKEQGKFQELVIEREKEIADLKNENINYKTSFDKAVKLSAFREQLGGTVDNSSYYDFVNVDEIVLDPDTGVVDNSSVESVVNQFKQTHSKLYTPKVSKALPNDAPRGPTTSIPPRNKDEFANALKDEIAKNFNL